MSNPPTVGPYQLMQELGRGKRSVVYKAWQTSVGRPVALKTLRHHDPDALKQFQAEARLSANLMTPGVRDIYEAGQTSDGCIYVVMEYVERSLKGLLRERFDHGQLFSRQEVGHLLMPIARALDDIHDEGLVHLDIKPANILVSKDGFAVLADFGIARRRGERTYEGTPLYMSPEQAAGTQPVGPWSDIYSLGVLIYEMTAGRPPFVSELDLVLVRQHLQDQPPAPRQFNPRLDRDLEQALLAALSKNPRQRPPTAMALLRRVYQLRPTPTPKGRENASRLPIKLVIIATVFIVLIPVLLLALGVILSQPSAMPKSSPTPTATGSSSTARAAVNTHSALAATTRATHTLFPAATAAPFRTPTRTINPTSTPLRLTGITVASPATAVPVNTPTSLEQHNGAVVSGTTGQFTWDGDIENSQSTTVKLSRAESGTALESEILTTTSWVNNLSLQDLSEPAQTHPLRPVQGRGFYGRTRAI